MELEEFIVKTMGQIFSGIKQAGEHAQATGAWIDPSQLVNVEFDVAVTTTEGSESTKGGGIKVWTLGLQGEAKNELTNSTVSRIKFYVPTCLPASGPRG